MYTSGPISGGHLSPIISISTHLRRSNFLSLKNLLGYMAAQTIGSCCAIGLMYWLLDGAGTFPSLSPASTSRAFQVELLFSLAISLVYLHTYTSNNQNAYAPLSTSPRTRAS